RKARRLARPSGTHPHLKPAQHAGRVGNFKFSWRFDSELLDDTVAQQCREALTAYAHAAGSEIQLKPQLAGPFAAAVAKHAHLAVRTLCAPPGAHDEGVVDRHTPDLIDAFRAQGVVQLKVAGEMFF